MSIVLISLKKKLQIFCSKSKKKTCTIGRNWNIIIQLKKKPFPDVVIKIIFL